MKAKDFFDQQAKNWDTNHRLDNDEKLERVVKEADIQPGQQILDVGSGTGILIPFMLAAMNGVGRIIALDYSRGMLDVARDKGFPETVSFVEADIHAVPFLDKAFDRVICNAAFPHFEDKARALAEMKRVLKPNGILIISHPIGRKAVEEIHKNASKTVNKHRVPTPEELSELFETAGLQLISIIDEEHFYLAKAVKEVTD